MGKSLTNKKKTKKSVPAEVFEKVIKELSFTKALP